MNIAYHYILAFSIRIALVLWGIFQDNILKVKYTDVDYHVFTDAADYVLKGESPFKRHTYRYTPFLAFLVTPNILLHISFGKIVFCMLDIFTSILIYHILKNSGYNFGVCKKSMFMWLYNPLAMVISSRGNAESVMTTLVMLTIYFLQINKPALCGIIYGLSIHFKIYPCIYAPSFYLNFSRFAFSNSTSIKLKALYMPELNKISFVLFTVLGFSLPTIISISLYGEKYIEEAILYHLFRKDIRHNFSIHFYLMYLSETVQSFLPTYLSILSMLTQLITIFLTAWIFLSPALFPFSLFIETYLFVTFNKVCTSQYFSWYVCLFPLAYPILKINSNQIIAMFALWLTGQGVWLYFAYLLEFNGENVFIWICIASLGFYLINMSLICYLIKHTKVKYNKKVTKKKLIKSEFIVF